MEKQVPNTICFLYLSSLHITTKGTLKKVTILNEYFVEKIVNMLIISMLTICMKKRVFKQIQVNKTKVFLWIIFFMDKMLVF